jgi:hypothetical protein
MEAETQDTTVADIDDLGNQNIIGTVGPGAKECAGRGDEGSSSMKRHTAKKNGVAPFF